MIYLETGSNSPTVNLAFEEYFLKSKDLGDEILMLWQNEPAVVIGRFQNIWGEVNLPYAEVHHIAVIRRISGGGTVYHDLGNLCFTFIVPRIVPEKLDLSQYSRRIQKALGQLGIPVELTQRNDLLLDGKKICGNAMSIQKGRLLFHGTLLYDANLEALHQVLSVPARKIETPAIQSRRSEVTTIKGSLRLTQEISAFKLSLKAVLLGEQASRVYQPTPGDVAAIQDLADSKYRTWQWNYGSNPFAKIELEYSHPGGRFETTLEVERGTLKTCRIRDAALTERQIGAMEQHLQNIRYAPEEIQAALEKVDVGEVEAGLTKGEIIRFLLGC
jgi:lipoate-protein ligase A